MTERMNMAQEDDDDDGTGGAEEEKEVELVHFWKGGRGGEFGQRRRWYKTVETKGRR